LTGDQSSVEPVETRGLDKLDQRPVEPVETRGLDQSPVELVETTGLDQSPVEPVETTGLDQSHTFRRGVRLALDWGKARIGVAACDPDGTLAYPVETVPAHNAGRRLPELLAEYQPIEVIIGLPRRLAGDEGPAAADVRAKVAALVGALPEVSWRFSDERLTTVDASRRLRAAGRSSRHQRAVIDQVAAVAILEQALAMERATGEPPGEPA